MYMYAIQKKKFVKICIKNTFFSKPRVCINVFVNFSLIREGTFVALKKRFLVDVLAHLYAPFLENGPLAKMQVGLVLLALLPIVVMWKTPTNVAPFNICVTSLQAPWFGHFFPSVEGQLALIAEDVEPLLYNSAHSSLLLPIVLPFRHLACRSTKDKILS
jgi:hypothetical protein